MYIYVDIHTYIPTSIDQRIDSRLDRSMDALTNERRNGLSNGLNTEGTCIEASTWMNEWNKAWMNLTNIKQTSNVFYNQAFYLSVSLSAVALLSPTFLRQPYSY